MASGACDDCRRRTVLLALLAPYLDRARYDGHRLREVLALPDEDLLRGAAGSQAPVVRRRLAATDAAEHAGACAEAGLAAVCRHDPRYPDVLRHAADAPAVLHLGGDATLLDRLAAAGGAGDDGERIPAVAIVGARRATEDGLEVARALGRHVAAAGVPVISGMALGVDSAAHAGALDAGGPTIAVLAGGADVPAPPSKRALHRQLRERALVVSEMPPGFRPYRWAFPARNRIIAALAAMTVVVEAAQRSGSLITADLAMQLGRLVGAVPGPVRSARAQGTNALLHEGAHVVRDAQDVLDALLPGRSPRSVADLAVGALPDRLREVLRLVEDGHDTPDALARELGDHAAALVALTELELEGLLQRSPSGRFVRGAGR